MLDERLSGKRGVAIGHAAIDKVVHYGLPISRPNYELWLTFLLGLSSELTADLRKLIEGGSPPTSHQFQELYERHFSNTLQSGEMMETGSKIKREITDALSALMVTGVATQRYGETLAVAGEALASGQVGGPALKQLASVLAGATTEMSKQNASLAGKLAQSSTEMEKLRTSLRQARADALTDALTGLANRKLLDETLRLRKEEADADRSELCLLLCDIDHFKSVNDTWGHQTGDQVIRFVASALTKFALPDHLVARYGGEEFAIVMPRTTLVQAGRIGEQIRTAIEAKRLVRRSTNEMIGAITVSFGGATYSNCETVSELVARADECLYVSKRNGRNRVTLENDRIEASSAGVA